MYLFAAAFAVFFLMLFVLIGLAMALSINGSNEFDTFSRPFLEILLAGYLVLSIFMMFKSFKGQRVKLPVIGSLAEKQANQVQKTR